VLICHLCSNWLWLECIYIIDGKCAYLHFVNTLPGAGLETTTFGLWVRDSTTPPSSHIMFTTKNKNHNLFCESVRGNWWSRPNIGKLFSTEVKLHLPNFITIGSKSNITPKNASPSIRHWSELMSSKTIGLSIWTLTMYLLKINYIGQLQQPLSRSQAKRVN